ncbi:MAG: outer-membrane lipoprotein carrier protein LolA [Hyphomonadaceae bacterium]|nr:outer-membrane lipoprotein carrier protein LolA [Hyphomonadaceae bacterium]
MSILLSTIFPLALTGALPPVAAYAPHMSIETPAAKPVPAKVQTAKPIAKPAIVLAPPQTKVQAPAFEAPQASGAQLIQIQQPAPNTKPATSAVDRPAIVERVGKALSDVKTAQGSFTQTDQGGSSSGAFYISRPGKVRFEYKQPEPMFLVSDGVSVSIEEPKRGSYDAVPLSSTPLNLFLRSNVDLKRDGSVTDVTTSNGSYFVTMVDKTGEAEGKMILEFRQSDFELLGWRAIDGAGSETRVKLTDMKKNVALKPALFVVKDPADERR